MFDPKIRLRSTRYIVVAAFVVTALFQAGFWMLRSDLALDAARVSTGNDTVAASVVRSNAAVSSALDPADPESGQDLDEEGRDIVRNEDDTPDIESRASEALPAEASPDLGAELDPEDDPVVPTPPPDQIWRLSFRAFPDTVGIGGYVCPGCDGVLSDADEMGAIGSRLNPLSVAVIEPGNPENVYWMGMLDRDSEAQADVRANVLLAVPPPYEIQLVSRNPLGYELCPNSPDVIFLTQDDFDAAVGGVPGTGRNLAQSWYFWRCLPDD